MKRLKRPMKLKERYKMSYSSTIRDLEIEEDGSWRDVERAYSNLQRARRRKSQSLINQMEREYSKVLDYHQKVVDTIFEKHTEHLDDIVEGRI